MGNMQQDESRSNSTVDFLRTAKQVFEIELFSGSCVMNRLDHSFEEACNLILQNSGNIIFMGVGKSGYIAKKIAATFISTGTSAFFIHPTEASHGDIGLISRKDLVIAFSYSGNTPELLSIIPTIRLLEVPIIAVTGNVNSSLAKIARVVLDIHVDREADPCGLAPTASTTVSLMLGDALAMAVSKAKKFTREDFARSHPGGILGRRLNNKVADLMKIGSEIPVVKDTISILDAIIEMSKKRLGMVVIKDDFGSVVGIFTDGDIRRAVERGVSLEQPINLVMSLHAKTILPSVLAYDALKIMQEAKITSLIVVNLQGELVGIVHIHDLLRLGLV